MDCEGVVFLEKALPGEGRVRVYELPAATMTSTVHHGGYSGLTAAYGELMGWINASSYRIAGPERELYHRGPATPGDQNDANCVTEIQFPVEKAA